MAQVSKAYADLITHTRNSAGGRFNAQGLYEMVAANQPRIDYDPMTLVLRGLLIEEQRTNLFTYSSEISRMAANSGATITADAEVAPDGSLTADVLNMTGSITSGAYKTGLVTSAAQHTFSVFLRFVSGDDPVARVGLDGSAYSGAGLATFNLLTGTITATSVGVTGFITPVGNGIYRCGATWAPTQSGTHNPLIYSGTTGTKKIAAWGAQLEAGAFPTSYIPTTSAQVTRAADVASVNTLSPWFNPDEGTILAEFTTMGKTGWPGVYSLAPDFFMYADAANKRTGISGRGSAGQLFKPVTQLQDTVIRRADSYDLQGMASAQDGAATTSNTLSQATKATGLGLGIGDNYRLNGHLRRIRYFPRSLSNADLQAMTA